MLPSPRAFYDHARNCWVCAVCKEMTDGCVCQAVPCPRRNDSEHGNDCPECNGENECFPDTKEQRT